MPKKITKKSNRGMQLGAGALAATALAVAGGYVLWENMSAGKKAKVKNWAMKARKEAVKNLAAAKKMSEVEYKRIVDQAVKHYGAIGGANKAELVKAATELKSEWKRIKQQAEKVSKQVKVSGQAPVKVKAKSAKSRKAK